MPYYTVTFTRHGFVSIEANSEEEAYNMVEGYGQEDISWSDDFETTDVNIED